jgi:transcription elongation factor Elf1
MLTRTRGEPHRKHFDNVPLLSTVGQDISDAEDAFSVLANDLRVQILEALADESGQDPVSFTDLYEAVDGQNTSQFSYHLTELTGRYVQQTSTGYVISDTGRRIIQSVTAGEYTLHPDFEPIDISTHCPFCNGTSAEATYNGQLATIACLSCGETVLRYDLRPGHTADRNSVQALKAADRQMRAEVSSALDGVCQRCGGSMVVEFLTESEAEPAVVLVVCDCQQCGTRLSAPVEMALLHHPEVISRYWGESVNVTTTPTWELLPELFDWNVEVDESGVATVVIPGREQLRFRVRCDEQVQTSLTDTVSRERPSSR